MKTNSKFPALAVIQLLFCGAGLLLMVLPKVIDTQYDLFIFGVALNGIGIMAFIYSQSVNRKS